MDYRKELLGQDIGWLQEGTREVLNAICTAFVRDSSNLVILSGCEVSYTLPNASVTAGYIYSRVSGEVLRVVASSVTATHINDLRLVQLAQPAPWGMVRFADNVPRQAHIDLVYTATNTSAGLNNTGIAANIPRLPVELAYKIDLTTLLIRLASLDTWHSIGSGGQPAFQNGWANHGTGAPVSYKKDSVNNRVLLRGQLSGGSLGGATMFTLPAGYKPIYGTEQACILRYGVTPVIGRLGVRADSGNEGALSIYADSSSGVTLVSLDGLSFPLD